MGERYCGNTARLLTDSDFDVFLLAVRVHHSLGICAETQLLARLLVIGMMNLCRPPPVPISRETGSRG